ncbi:piggyBac transposable element-derived protein 2-like [Erpetoichthys calabaricus]|uniref:piggyBac transposable element-derived protein 2-like n=1 Tax=Erpetoichthys calabaricus TaxID=27687 RepID=UPI0010A0118B|nr:piggyBac transposable element-derived protein 2-like [Erpetoichthys calabaricus]
MAKRCITLDEVSQLLEDCEEKYSEATVCVLPPNTSQLSDEDEGDEDVANAGNVTVADVPGELEVEMVGEDMEDDTLFENEGDDAETEENQPSTSSAPPAKWPRKKKCPVPSWTKQKKPVFPKTSALNGQAAGVTENKLRQTLAQHNPVQLFEEFFSPEIYDLICKETVRYSTDFRNDHEFHTSTEEVKVFLGILIITGYHKVPSEADYWSDAEDLVVPIVKNAMSRNRFQKLKSYIHFVDNSTADSNIGDQSFKVKPLFELLNENFCKFGYFTPNISIDEMIVKYYGRNSLKQFIKGKPIRFGYKYWAICSSEGYCYTFSLYCGKETTATDVPLGSRVVLNAVQHIADPSSYALYFDNFFTNMDLLSQLADRGFRATATIRENRINRTCPMKSSKEMKKSDRGASEYVYDRTSEVLLVRWHDNNIVTVATNHDSIELLHDVKRRVKGQKEKSTVKMPNLIYNYNVYMGGVDHHDWLVSKYCVSIRGKKWYWPLFTRCIDMAIVNAWILHKSIHGGNAISLKDFRRAIAIVYLKTTVQRKHAGRPRVPRLPTGADIMRYDGVGHFLMQRDKQRRCQREGCKGKPKTYCNKCNTTLCRTCFQPYHDK